MKEPSSWGISFLFTLALTACPATSTPPCGAPGEPCCNGVSCSTGLVCLSNACAVPRGGGGGSSSSQAGGSTGGLSTSGSTTTSAGSGTGGSSSTLGSSSSGGASSSAPACGGVSQACCAGGACNGSLSCQGGSCSQAPAGVTGTPCSKNSDCPTGICLPVGQPVGGQPSGGSPWTGNVCTTACTSSATCVAGWSCAPLIGQTSDVCTCSYSPEVCDGKDDDCDGIVDDEPAVDQGCQQTLGSAAACQAGQCSCAGGTTDCGGQCVNTAVDDQNCGGCGQVCNAVGESCQGGGCACPNGESPCGGACVDTSTDPNNCGGCNQACTVAGQSCEGGGCVCPSGESPCGSSCADTSSDPYNCGGCNQACTVVGQSCQGGSCACPSGESPCGGTCVNTSSDPRNCGGCNQACTVVGESCDVGACACPASQTACGSSCVTTATDPANCGGCSKACDLDAGQTFQGGQCQCPKGETACAGTCTNLLSDPNNCSACGHACSGVNDVCLAVACGRLLATTAYPHSDQSLALQGGEIYWLDDAQNVDALPVNGGTPRQLYDGAASYGAIAVTTDSTYLYVSAGGSFLQIPLDGGQAFPFGDIGLNAPQSLVVDSTSLYYADYGNAQNASNPFGTVGRFALNGGAAFFYTPPGEPPGPNGVAIDGQNVYWTTPSEIVSEPLDGGSKVTLVSSGSNGPPVVSGGELFWVSASSPGEIQMIPTSGGTPAVVVPVVTDCNGLAASSGWLYWSDVTTNGGGLIQKALLDGGSPVQLAVTPGGNNAPGSLAVDGTSVYWVDSGGHLWAAPR